MEKNKTKNNDAPVIDLWYIFKGLWHRAWIIALVSVITAGTWFVNAKYLTKPTYSSSIMLYVNNSYKTQNPSYSISASEIYAAQVLVNTYREILYNVSTLQRVAEKAGPTYSAGQIGGMISAGSVNETEIMYITVYASNADDAAYIANIIAEVLPMRVLEVIDGSSVEVLNYATPNYGKVAPNVSSETVTGFLIGFAASTAILALLLFLDNTIHDEEYILENYDYPVLAKIPNLISSNSKSYGYYKQKSSKSVNN